MSFYRMATVDLTAADYTAEELEILKLVVKRDGTIRASKPKLDRNKPLTGKAAFVWRMLVFSVSHNPQHQCMPIMCYYDLPCRVNGKWDHKLEKSMSDELNVLVDKVLATIPKHEWAGVMRWASVLGR